MSEDKEIIAQSGGFDAAVTQRGDDKLNRWPFAKEIYGIATTGPKDWPVRIGIYGEWGTGKTSVLNMVGKLAESHGHIVIPFNPWEFSDKQSLWHAFVQTVAQKLPHDVVERQCTYSQWFKRKGLPAADWVSQHSAEINDIADNSKVGSIMLGVGILKGFLLSKRSDLQKLLKNLNGRRLIILIDDLDRTSSEIVPEMLFAIKELMNIGGIVFICAFDPVIVGRILAEQHTGIDGGLKFLEKIIDYPRWLPAVSTTDLLRMAEADVEKHCPFVPQGVLASVLSYLPQNARSVRQFVRLIALMRPQVERHRADEIQWPVILAANVIKIRFPQLAPGLLGDKELWHKIGVRSALPDEKDEIGELLKAHALKTEKDFEIDVSEKDREQIIAVLRLLVEQVNAWTGIGEERLMYQMRLAEEPAAVTLKEFDSFFSTHGEKARAQEFDTWIKTHSNIVEQTGQEVYQALFAITVRSRQAFLDRAAEAIDEEGMAQALATSEVLLKSLEVLTFELSQNSERDYHLNATAFKLALSSFEYYAHFTNTQAYRDIRQKEVSFLRRFVESWEGSVSPLVEIIEPFSFYRHDMKGKEIVALYKMMSNQVIPRYAKEVLGRFREQDFVPYMRQAYTVQVLVFDVEGPLWRDLRGEMLKLLSNASDDATIRHNAYALLNWFDYTIRRESPAGQEAQRMIKILTDQGIAQALWSAAIAQPLNPRAVGAFRDFPENCKKYCNVDLKRPYWWTLAIENIELAEKREVPEAGKAAD